MNRILNEIKREKLQIFLVILSGILLIFHHISQPGFFMDGLIYSAISKNMALDNLFLAPHISETYFASFHDHIPFMLILQALFFKVFGIGFWQARVFVNLFTLGIFLLVIRKAYKAGMLPQLIFAAVLFFITLPMLKHGRAPNFDIPLALTVFASIHFYSKAFEDNRFKNWLWCGVFFGLSMLLKGPMAVFIPLTILIHLLVTKNVNRFLDYKPWLGLLSGFIVFSIWPVALYFTGHFEIFQEWFKFTIIDTIFGSRGVVKNDYLLYLKHLLTFTPLHILFFGISLYRLRGKYTSTFTINAILIFVILLLTSYMKFKLSHYIMCVYAPLIYCASFAFDTNKLKKAMPILFSIVVIGSMVNFFLPQNPKKNRDFEIFEIQRIAREKKLEVVKYYDLYTSYPYWSMASLIPFTESKNVYQSFDSNFSKSIVITNKENPHPTCFEIYNLDAYKAKAYYCP